METSLSQRVRCPLRRAFWQDGRYDFVGKVIAAFRAPGVTHEDNFAFREIVEAKRNREISSDEAANQIEAINHCL